MRSLVLTAALLPLWLGACARSPESSDRSGTSSPTASPDAAEDVGETDVGNAQAAPMGLLVTVAEVGERLDQPQLRAVDVRSRNAYDAGHIPGAVSVDVNEWKSASLVDGGLYDAAAWSERVGKLGITRDTNVVVYGDNPTNATRIWWTLKYLGVRHVGILNGGWEAWEDAAATVSTDEPVVAAVDFQPEFQPDRLAEMDEVRSHLGDDSVTIIDTRSDQEFTGSGGPGPRRGHLPGAVHQEWKQFVDEEGRFKSTDEITSLLAGAGLKAESTNITHCQTGGRASLNAFVMELAGYGPAKNYYCGWSEWSPTEDAPIESPGATEAPPR